MCYFDDGVQQSRVQSTLEIQVKSLTDMLIMLAAMWWQNDFEDISHDNSYYTPKRIYLKPSYMPYVSINHHNLLYYGIIISLVVTYFITQVSQHWSVWTWMILYGWWGGGGEIPMMIGK